MGHPAGRDRETLPSYGEEGEDDDQAEINRFVSNIQRSKRIGGLRDAFSSASENELISKSQFLDVAKQFDLKHNLIDLNMFFADGGVTWDNYINFMAQKKQRRDVL